jgi:ADP-heptose:LPS heptosyltransferase
MTLGIAPAMEGRAPPRSSLGAGPRLAPASILIVRLGAIGDVVHGLPLLCRLRRGFPAAWIAWAVGPAAAPLLDGHPALDERIVLEKRAPVSFLRRCLALRGRFEVAIDLQGLVSSALAAAIAGARRRLSFDRARTREGAFLFHTERLLPAARDGPIVAQNLAFADALGAPPAPIEFRLAPGEKARERARALLANEPFAAIILGAGKAANRPGAALLAESARRLARAGLLPVLFGGPTDRAEGRAIAAESGARDLVGATDLATLAALLERAAVAIGGDTGPIHIAAALGTPVVAIFGPANPGRTGPVGARSRVLWRRWPCAPCYRRQCPTDRGCMASISADEVVAAALDLGAKAPFLPRAPLCGGAFLL